MRNSKIMRVAAVLGVAVLAGCGDEFDVPNYFAGSIDQLTSGNASKTAIATAAQGLPYNSRTVLSSIVSTFGEVGREGYSLDPANPDAQSRRLRVLDRALASGTWTNGYRDIRQANIILRAVESSDGLTEQEKEGLRGWAKTFLAHDLLIMLNVFDESGIAIDVDREVNAALPPIVPKAQAFAHILKLLDEAKAHLLRAGTTFAFDPGAGFAGLNTPAGFLKVNRAIKARVDVYNRNWAAALTSVGESFIDTNGALNFGGNFVYSTRTGDEVNPLYDPTPRTLVAHQTTVTEAQRRADGTPDLRATSKTAPITPRVVAGITADMKWDIYKSQSDPIPMIKNEELILLRAEANFQLGNRAAAIADLNVVRTRSGGLAPLPANYSGDLLAEVLYNRRYSLLWEGAHRWIDMRRYNKLAELPKYLPAHVIFRYAPLPDAECLARTDSVPAGCSIPSAL